MDPIENEYKKRFSDQKLSNDDFDSDGLWDAIAEDLDQKTHTVGGFFMGQKWPFGILLLLILTGVFFFIYQDKGSNSIADANTNIAVEQAVSSREEKNIANKSSENNRDEAAQNNVATRSANAAVQETINESVSSNTADSKQVNKATQGVSDDTQKAVSQENKAPTNSDINKTSNTSLQTNSTTNEDQITEPIASSVLTNNADEKLDQQSLAKQINTIQENTTSNANQLLEKELGSQVHQESTFENKQFESRFPANESSTNIAAPIAANSKVALLPKLIFHVNQPLPSLDKSVVNNESETRIRPAKRTNWLMGFSGGPNYATYKFTNTGDPVDGPTKNETEKAAFGTSYGVNASLILRKKWLLQTGVEYHRFWSKLAHQYSFDSTILRENVLLQVVVDSAGNVLNEIYGNQLVDTTATRTIIHHNKYTVFSLPLEFGFIKRHSKWIYGLSAGLVFNFQTNQVGRTFNPQNELILFTKNDPPAIYESFNIGFRVSPFLGYQIKDGLMFTLAPKWTWQSNTIFNNPDLSVKIQQFNLNVGLQVAF